MWFCQFSMERTMSIVVMVTWEGQSPLYERSSDTRPVKIITVNIWWLMSISVGATIFSKLRQIVLFPVGCYKMLEPSLAFFFAWDIAISFYKVHYCNRYKILDSDFVPKQIKLTYWYTLLDLYIWDTRSPTWRSTLLHLLLARCRSCDRRLAESSCQIWKRYLCWADGS